MTEGGADLGAAGVKLHQLRLVVPDAVVDGDGILPRNCHRDALRVMLHIAEPTTVAMRVLGAVNTSAFGLSALFRLFRLLACQTLDDLTTPLGASGDD